MPSFSNAFKCKKCPESNSKNGCPCWTELTETNIATGEHKTTKNCIFQLMPLLLVEVIKASNRPAQEISHTKNEIVKGFNNIQNAINAERLLK